MKRKLAVVSMIALLVGNVWGRVELALHRLSIPPGQSEVQSLCDLYDAGLSDELFSDASRDLADPRLSAYFPRILYIRWQACRRLAMLPAADAIRGHFLSQFPRDPLGAEMLWDLGMRRLAAQDYAGASAVLEEIRRQYAASPVAVRARETLAVLQ
jgi:hypothetical protein